MSHERLHQILKDLQHELRTTEALTEEDRSHLSGVVDQIRSVLDDASDEGSDSVLEVIDDAALHFESGHPGLTKTLYQISELLRAAGLT